MYKDSLFDYMPSQKFEAVLKEYKGTYLNAEKLKQKVKVYLEDIKKETIYNEFINITLADKIGNVCIFLLDQYNKYNKEEQQFINVTVNYFLACNDEEEDLYSPLGFDDDAEILNECLKLIKKEDLIIDIE